jgi:hypothetical protein
MAQTMKPKDQKLIKPVLQGDPEDELPMPPSYIPNHSIQGRHHSS